MRVRETTPVEHLIAGLTRELAARSIGFMLIGGQAVLAHGEPRLTDDIDLTLAATPDQLADVVGVCAALGLTPLPSDVPRFVAETFVLPVRHGLTGFRVDFVFSSTEYERLAISRAVRIAMAGAEVPFATAEDLLIHKLFAARPRDLEDAAGVVRRKGAALDWDYMRHWARAFADVPGRSEMPAMLEALRTPPA
jgi:predicted nucleotidyltransferase